MRLKNIIVFTFLINLVIMVIAYNVLGLLLTLGVFGLVYYVVQEKFEDKKGRGQKLAFASTHLIGILGVNKIFGMAEITLFAFILESIVLVVFLNVSD